MGWTTLYIAGKEDFREEVKERLEHSDLDIMPGYTGTYMESGEVHELYWMDEKMNLRAIKEAIGSKIVWKYRLKFYGSLEALTESQNRMKKSRAELTDEDFALLEEMRAAIR